jgi:hypothetical protein
MPMYRVLCSTIAIALLQLSSAVTAQEVRIDFESATIGKPVPVWTEAGVEFALAHEPQKSNAKGRVMFFPHLGSDHKGILNAMADESIPVRANFDRPVQVATLTLWGSTTSSALIEAFDADGKLIASAGLDQVPVRTKPEDSIPMFELSVAGEGIAYLQVSGSQPGGFVAIDELRFTYADPVTAGDCSPQESSIRTVSSERGRACLRRNQW